MKRENTYHRQNDNGPSDPWKHTPGQIHREANAIRYADNAAYELHKETYSPRLDDFIQRHYLLPDRIAVQQCRNGHLVRLRHKDGGPDKLSLRRCKHWLCPHCAPIDARQRADYEIAKFASLNPCKDSLSVGHTIFSIPLELNDLIARHGKRALQAWRAAAFQTMALGLRIHSDKTSRTQNEANARRQLAAVFHLHPYGDDNFLKPAFHLDAVFNGYKLTPNGPEPLPPRITYGYRKLRKEYENRLRHALLPLANLTEQLHLKDPHFVADIHIVQNKKAERPWIVKNDQAAAVIHYSARPHFDPSRITYFPPYDTDPERLIYEPRGNKRLHRLNPRNAMRRVYAMKNQLAGPELTAWHGYASKNQYSNAARTFGHTPVQRKRKTGWTLIERLEQDRQGNWRKTY